MRRKSLLKSLTLLLTIVGAFLKSVVTLEWFERKEMATTLLSNSQHKEDTRRPVRGGLDRNVKKRKTEEKVLSDNEKKAMKAVGGMDA